MKEKDTNEQKAATDEVRKQILVREIRSRMEFLDEFSDEEVLEKTKGMTLVASIKANIALRDAFNVMSIEFEKANKKIAQAIGHLNKRCDKRKKTL